MHCYTCISAYRQADRQAAKQADRQTDRYAYECLCAYILYIHTSMYIP